MAIVHKKLILSCDMLNSETGSQGKFFWVCVLVMIVVFYCFSSFYAVQPLISDHLPSRSTKGSLSLGFMPVMYTNMVLKKMEVSISF